ncbi:Proteasome subunit beta type [Spironucleus salmonicida]|uniref:proteasome endopeptidase complex n=1 Tax=Spironucleus salmonicida TaxID=348837 RepID=V6LE69_9EUKA|nr:Proteasome subunit beta type [Spironucleus salmonicida]|eukprot:EST42573.1 Proteasome subunit beta type [Spironucleus salmonicida]
MTQFLQQLNPYNNSKVSDGTTLIAIKCVDGVVLSADTRTSSDIRIENRVSRKLEHITDQIMVGCSGSAADTRALCRILRNHIYEHELQIGQKCAIKTAANLLAKMNFQYRAQLLAGLLVCGVDSTGYHVFKVMPGGTFIEENMLMSGSGSTYVYALADELYNDSLTMEQGVAVCKKLLRYAGKFDGSSGGLMRWVKIGANGSDYFEEDNMEVMF